MKDITILKVVGIYLPDRLVDTSGTSLLDKTPFTDVILRDFQLGPDNESATDDTWISGEAVASLHNILDLAKARSSGKDGSRLGVQ